MPRGVSNTKSNLPVVARQLSFQDVLHNWPAFVAIAESLSRSGKTGEVRSKESILAVALQGAELGIPPMTAINCIHPIKGRLSLSASAAQALVLRDLPGSTFAIDDSVKDRCTVTLTVPGRPPFTSTYTMDDARAADLVKKDSGWTKFPTDMLFAKAVLRACRRVAPDVLAGMYSPEELGEVIDVETITVEPRQPGVVGATDSQGIDMGEPVDAEELGRAQLQLPEPQPPSSEPIRTPPTVAAEVVTATPHVNGTNMPMSVAAAPSPPAANRLAPAVVVDGKATSAQLNCLRTLKTDLYVGNNEWGPLVASVQPGAKSATELSSAAADQLIGILRLRAKEGGAEKNSTSATAPS